MDIKEKVIEICNLLDEIDEHQEMLPRLESETDLAVSDIYHFIETNNFNYKTAYELIKELKAKLLYRRNIKKDISMMAVLNTHQGKLIQKDNRKLLLSELGKREKQLNSEYNYRIYEKEELIEKCFKKKEENK